MTTPFSGEWAEFDGKLYHLKCRYQLVQSQKGSPITTTNTTLEKDGKTYIIDENGVATEKKININNNLKQQPFENTSFLPKCIQKHQKSFFLVFSFV